MERVERVGLLRGGFRHRSERLEEILEARGLRGDLVRDAGYFVRRPDLGEQRGQGLEDPDEIRGHLLGLRPVESRLLLGRQGGSGGEQEEAEEPGSQSHAFVLRMGDPPSYLAATPRATSAYLARIAAIWIPAFIAGVVGGFAGLAMGAVFAFTAWASPGFGDHPYRRACASNLRQIGAALSIYQTRNDGALPDADGVAFLSRLRETEILGDPKVFLCLNSGEEAASARALRKGTCSYLGRRNTGDLRLVLFADGHVEEVLEEAFQAAHAPTLAE